MTERRGKPHPKHIVRDGSTLCGIPDHVLWGTVENDTICQPCVLAWAGVHQEAKP